MFDSLLQFCRLQQVVSRIQHRIASMYSKVFVKSHKIWNSETLVSPLSAYEKLSHKFHITPP